MASQQEEIYRRSPNAFIQQQAPQMTQYQNKEEFRRSMKDYENQYLQYENQSTQSQYFPQKRIQNNYMPAQNTLSENFLQQTFLSDTNSFVQYQKIVNQNNPKEMEALNQYYESLPPQQKQFVRPNPYLEFKEQDLPGQYQRFKIPRNQNAPPQGQSQQALFDNDATLFGRNILTLCENQVVSQAPSHLKNYINLLGGIEDTISAMEDSLKHNELKNLEDKYINYYVHYMPNHQQIQQQQQLQGQVMPLANPFSKKPSESLISNIPLIPVNHQDQNQPQQDIIREEQSENQYSFQEERAQPNFIILQSKKLREEKMKFLQQLK